MALKEGQEDCTIETVPHGNGFAKQMEGLCAMALQADPNIQTAGTIVFQVTTEGTWNLTIDGLKLVGNEGKFRITAKCLTPETGEACEVPPDAVPLLPMRFEEVVITHFGDGETETHIVQGGFELARAGVEGVTEVRDVVSGDLLGVLGSPDYTQMQRQPDGAYLDVAHASLGAQPKEHTHDDGCAHIPSGDFTLLLATCVALIKRKKALKS